MKELIPYSGNCFKIHQNAVNRKNKGDLKNRLIGLNNQIQIEFDNYSENFNKNTLYKITPNSTIASSKDDLLSLYDFQSKVIRDLRDKIKNQQIRTIISTCQNCTIDSANSLDHILPQTRYPEFVVNPLNLFPCCTRCNSYKLNAVANATERNFLNLYLDVLPSEQYLFVDVFMDVNNDLDFSFTLRNVKNLIPVPLFTILENHYAKLYLYERFKFKSIEYVSELEAKIRSFLPYLPMAKIKETLSDAVVAQKAAYGDNHWKCVLELALINSELFMKQFST